MASLSLSPKHAYLQSVDVLPQFIENADHVDIKTIEGEVNLREFVANMFSYQPAWISFLYRVRAVFVRFLGMKQEGIPQAYKMNPDTIDFTAGRHLTFFVIDAAREDAYVFASADDSHLRAMLGIVREPLADNQSRYYAITIVHYHNWAGPIYFNVIRPFHHIVVNSMMRSGLRAS